MKSRMAAVEAANRLNQELAQLPVPPFRVKGGVLYTPTHYATRERGAWTVARTWTRAPGQGALHEVQP